MNSMTNPRTRRSPFFASTDLAEMFDAFLGSPHPAMTSGASALPTTATPSMPIDVHEDADGITVVANVPGFAKDEVHVEFHEGVLTLSAMRESAAASTEPAAAPKKDDACCGSGACCAGAAPGKQDAAAKPRARTVIRERSACGVRRALQMPDRVTGDGISAELADGVLTVRLPYAARPTPRKISVN